MKEEHKELLCLLKKAIATEDNGEPITITDWGNVYRNATKQSVAAIIFDLLERKGGNRFAQKTNGRVAGTVIVSKVHLRTICAGYLKVGIFLCHSTHSDAFAQRIWALTELSKARAEKCWGHRYLPIRGKGVW